MYGEYLSQSADIIWRRKSILFMLGYQFESSSNMLYIIILIDCYNISITSMITTHAQQREDCCFSSLFKSNANRTYRKYEEHLFSQNKKLNGPTFTNSRQLQSSDFKFKPQQTDFKINQQKNDIFHDKTQSVKEKGELSSKIRRLINVKLDYSLDNLEEQVKDVKNVQVQEVQSEILQVNERKQEEADSNFIVMESQILHNYFNTQQIIKDGNRTQTEVKTSDEKKKIKRLFKNKKFVHSS